MWQDAYVRLLLEEAQRLEMEYVVWWASTDFDALMAYFPPESVPIGLFWRDTGLFDENDSARPGVESWDAWLHLP